MPDESFGGMPEVMASLRSLGSSRRVHGRAEHLRFFAPLLDARRAAADARSRADVVAAFAAARLVAALDRVVADLAAERFPARPPARRALATELADASAPLRSALVALDALGPGAVAGGDDAVWQAWLAQLRACFAAADALWPALDTALASLAPEDRS